jgi:hypothetical protein
MTEVQASTQLAGATKLWRYFSLDKLVDLLSTSELFFTPLATFVKTDPFEGYLPSVALDAYASVFRKYADALEVSHQQVAEHREKCGYPLTDAERERLQASLADYRSVHRRLLPAIAKATMVNCWHHAGESESEAMWRLYAENGKAAAVETTFDALKESIQRRESSSVVYIYPVKYLNFFDSALKPGDCLVEGIHMPLLKRISYQHEREVRAFIAKVAPGRAGADVAFWEPAPIRLPIDVKVLVKAIHISPYAGEPFPGSVAKICEAFGLESGIVRPSQLLSGHEELLDRLSL